MRPEKGGQGIGGLAVLDMPIHKHHVGAADDKGVERTDAVDYFYSLVNPGAANLGRIVFSGFAAASTKWQPYDHQITPVPESSVYGAVLLGLSALFATWRLNRRRTS